MSKINNVPQYKIVTKLNLIINYNDSSPVGDEDGRLEKGEFSCGIKQPKVNYQGVYVYAFHSQSVKEPTGGELCPNGFKPLWKGYSFIGAGHDIDVRADGLGGPGSCLRYKKIPPFVECNKSKCEYKTADDRQVWLAAENGNVNSENRKISRCQVCEGTKKLLVIHSQTKNEPKTPDGWSRLWKGYSFFGGGGGSDFGNSPVGPSSLSLSSIGSCLRKFVPLAFVECGRKGDCGHGTYTDWSAWLVREWVEQVKSLDKKYISLCAVFMKD